MDSTAKLNEFKLAPSSKMVRAKFIASFQIPATANGHSRSLPAEIDGTIVSPRFRSGKANELPIDITGSFVSSEPALEPIADPTLAPGPLGE
jgi:hypothetical protein